MLIDRGIHKVCSTIILSNCLCFPLTMVLSANSLVSVAQRRYWQHSQQRVLNQIL